MANIFKAAKGFLKEDLLFVAEEIGKIFSDKLEYEESGKIRIHELELARIKATLPVSGEPQNTVISGAKKKFNLPKLEFRQFSGDIKDWLQFWSQFLYIHDDDEIVPENKFQYLVQATVNGSRAREVVERFPTTTANYAKAVESLKARFGRDDLLVEVYVRELLKLISSVQKQEKISMTSMYDKLESYLRALETLGVTTEKFASILYPRVESCFQEDFLKAWNRSATSATSTDA
ncbi:integrase catalytic domain-containing protein [Trichonephila clavipes]|nr:integrase catalytic domain-containing protein [Trichonephila clavipes]